MTLSRILRWLAALLWTGAVAVSGGPDAGGRYLFKSYGPEQGLVDPSFTSLAQDGDGFLWIGTQSGLVRYDGTQFKKWTASEGLPASYVYGLQSIRGGGLWVSTAEGLVRFDQGISHKARMAGKDLVGGASCMDMDRDDHLCFLRRDGLYRQTRGDEFELLPGRPKGRSTCIACSAATGSIFIGSDSAFWERRKDGTWVSLGAEVGLNLEGLWAAAEDARGRLWVAGTKKLFFRDAGENTFHDASALLPGPLFTDGQILKGVDGSVCIPTNQGLLRALGDDHELIDSPRGLPSRWARAGLLDREGNLWILGPFLYRQLGRGYVRAYIAEDGLPGEVIWTMFQDPKGRMWAGTNDGLALLGPQGWTRIPGTEALSVSSTAQDPRGWLWIGLNSAPVRCLKPGETTATEQPFKDLRWMGGNGKQEPPDSAGTVFVDREGTLWLGNYGRGLYRVNLSSGEIHPEFGPADAKVPALSIVCILEDGRGRIWAATQSGLLCRENGQWHLLSMAQGLMHDDVQGMALDRDDTLWVWYSEPSGMTRVSCEQGVLKVLERRDTSHGLASNSVFTVIRDGKGCLWVGTDRGLDRFDKDSTMHFGRGNGLVGEDCTANSICLDSGGDLWQGTSTGVARVFASKDPPPLQPSRVFILQVEKGKTSLFPPFGDQGPVSHRDASLEFRFSAPTFINEAAVRYQVRMVGLEEEWRTTDVHQARYAALPGGRYRFEVRAAYPGGAFGPVAAFETLVLPPWWRSWWFICIEVLAVAGAVGLGVEGRLKALARQKARLEALVAERTRDLQKANHALEEANVALENQSLTDPLTTLHNRRYLSVVVDDDVAEVQRVYREVGWNFLVNQDLIFFMVDLDHFKHINDRFGHGVGDQVLQVVAKVLRGAARETDAVIRWGGEEFLIVARNASRSEAQGMAERIRALMAIQALELESGEVVRWTCSVGFAALPFQPKDIGWLGWERVVELADACLYVAKKSGRNAWVGIQACESLDRAQHGQRIPWELQSLSEEGVVEVFSSRDDPFGKGRRVGEILG